MTRKRLEKEERKKQIKKAAVELIAKHGYAKTSVQDIVDRANFSKGGFYNCYASKEELFKDIMQDGMNVRYEKVRNLKTQVKDIDQKTFIVEGMLEKILDSNDYKKLFAVLIIEMAANEKFFTLYQETVDEMIPQFLDFCTEVGFDGLKNLVNDEFNVFISSLILGAEILKQNNNPKYRALLKEILTAYFEKKKEFFEIYEASAALQRKI